MAAVRETKSCACCSKPFFKRARDSQAQWLGREFCSILCANRSKKEKTPAETRFWNFVEVGQANACWLWSGSVDGAGYGTISDEHGASPLKAHRLSWEIHFFPIPDGLNVCHACDTPACVNPSHLMLGTQMANSLDTARKQRLNANSLLNLRPGHAGYHGAGPQSNMEIINGIR